MTPDDLMMYRVMDRVYPVGTPYFNVTDSRNPNLILGFGVWDQLKGMVLAGKDDTGVFATLGDQLGVKEVILTQAQLARVIGSFYIADNVAVNSSATNPKIGAATNAFSAFSRNSNNVIATSTSVVVGNKVAGVNMDFGNDEPHTNIQPSLVVMMWVRVK